MKTQFCLVLLLVMTGAVQVNADMLTTTFNFNGGQSGNMFDVVVLNANGIDVEMFDVNLDAGTWDLEVWSIDSAYAGFETNSAAWTLRDTTTGIVSNGAGVATPWDLADFSLNGNSTSAIYITVSNGSALNYTNGTTEGAVFASDANIQILEGTGNSYSFGAQFRPRIWNGTFYYTPTAIPEPMSTQIVVLTFLGFVSFRRRSR